MRKIIIFQITNTEERRGLFSNVFIRYRVYFTTHYLYLTPSRDSVDFRESGIGPFDSNVLRDQPPVGREFSSGSTMANLEYLSDNTR